MGASYECHSGTRRRGKKCRNPYESGTKAAPIPLVIAMTHRNRLDTVESRKVLRPLWRPPPDIRTFEREATAVR
jgi:hypothetical protein